MEISPDTWYRLGDLLDPSGVELQDGSSIRSGSTSFRGSTLESLTGVATRTEQGARVREPARRYRYLQLVLQNVDRDDLDGLPTPVSISSRLLRENLLLLGSSSYAYDVLVRDGAEIYSAQGDVCAAWAPSPGRRSTEVPLDKRREVMAAHRSGLLDDVGKSKADFRLGIKPIQRRLAEALDSGYLESIDWQVSVVFARWFAGRTKTSVPTPVASDGDTAALDHLEIQLLRHTRRRDFRVSDLFDRRSPLR